MNLEKVYKIIVSTMIAITLSFAVAVHKTVSEFDCFVFLMMFILLIVVEVIFEMLGRINRKSEQ